MKTKKTVLLIDDDKDEHEFFCEALKKYNSSVVCVAAYTLREGYRLVEETPPDYIFLDFNMPGANGIECLRKIKKMEAWKHIPVYMYSASYVQGAIKGLALEEGALEWIKKPINLKDYERIFSDVIHESKL